MPWECVLDLVERGAQISLKNRAGVRAADLAPSCLLARLQDQMLNDCRTGLGAGSSTTGPVVPPSGIGPDPSGNCTASLTSVARSSNPARILRKLRTSSGTTALGPLPLRMESTEEASSASVEMLALSSTGSVRSRTSRYSLETGAALGSNNNNNNNNNKVRINTIFFRIYYRKLPNFCVRLPCCFGSVEVKERCFSSTCHEGITSALDGGEYLASLFVRFIFGDSVPGTHFIGGWVVTRSVLNNFY